MDSVMFRPDGGMKYIKVKSFQVNINTDYNDDGTTTKTLVGGDKGSIHCFVEKQTGNIFKPAGYKTPYLKGGNAIRGNIYDSSTFEKTDLENLHSVFYNKNDATKQLLHSSTMVSVPTSGVSGNFGFDLRSNRPVLDIVLEQLPHTLLLASSAAHLL